MLSVSLIIPVKDRTSDLKELLAQLNRQSYSGFEVVVVDDGSQPPVTNEVDPASYHFPIRVIRSEKCGGIGRARNTGVAAATGVLIVFVDSDGVVEDTDWLKRHVAFHEREEISGTVLTSQINGIHSTYAGYSFGYSNWFMSCGRRHHTITDHHVPMHNTSMRKSVFDAVGMFDEDLEVAEDVEWSFRCLNKGIRLVYSPDMPVGHKDRETWTQLWKSYRKMGRFAHLVRLKREACPYRGLFPFNRLTAWLYFLPLTGLMTGYILVAWIPIDLRVFWYLPGMYVANVAYYLGIVDSLLRTKTLAVNKESARGR